MARTLLEARKLVVECEEWEQGLLQTIGEMKEEMENSNQPPYWFRDQRETIQRLQNELYEARSKKADAKREVLELEAAAAKRREQRSAIDGSTQSAVGRALLMCPKCSEKASFAVAEVRAGLKCKKCGAMLVA